MKIFFADKPCGACDKKVQVYPKPQTKEGESKGRMFDNYNLCGDCDEIYKRLSTPIQFKWGPLPDDIEKIKKELINIRA